MFNVEDPDPLLIDAGLKLAPAPLGKPLTLRSIAPVNPPDGITVAV